MLLLLRRLVTIAVNPATAPPCVQGLVSLCQAAGPRPLRTPRLAHHAAEEQHEPLRPLAAAGGADGGGSGACGDGKRRTADAQAQPGAARYAAASDGAAPLQSRQRSRWWQPPEGRLRGVRSRSRGRSRSRRRHARPPRAAADSWRPLPLLTPPSSPLHPSPNPGVTRYTLDVSVGPANPDCGSKREVILVNGLFQPTLEVAQGDRLEVRRFGRRGRMGAAWGRKGLLWGRMASVRRCMGLCMGLHSSCSRCWRWLAPNPSWPAPLQTLHATPPPLSSGPSDQQHPGQLA